MINKIKRGVVVFLLLGCTKEITTDDGQTITLPWYKTCTRVIRSEKHVSSNTKTISCTYPGVCCECGLTFRANFECGCGLRPMCDGKQEAIIRVKIINYSCTYHYDNQAFVTTEIERHTTTEALEMCQ